MDVRLLGWPGDDVTLDLDWRRFAYAGKFVVGSTGKAVAEDGTETVGAAAFDPDRTDEETLVIRYVTVRDDRQGEGIGPTLLAFVRDRALDRGYRAVRIAVNNPHAYEAAYRAGFAFTGETSGTAEVVLAATGEPSDRDEGAGTRYRAGLDHFDGRDDGRFAAFLERQRAAGPPTSATDSERGMERDTGSDTE